MATIADISQVLGEYMLKGWVLTDQACPTAGCTIPMLRSPQGRTPITSFCVKCTGGEGNTEKPKAPVSSNTSTFSPRSSVSTPPTEFSSAPGSPVFIPLEESEESRQRRAQSDLASSEIGKRLLKGWAMLGEECPNNTCYGVPLVRPPKPGPEKDPRKECVICGRVYVKEVDWAGRENLVLQSTSSYQSTHVQSYSRSTCQGHTDSPVGLPLPPLSGQETLDSKQKIPRETAEISFQSTHSSTKQAPTNKSIFKPSGKTINDTLEALEHSLQALTGRLKLLSSQSIVDPISISTTVDAINKIALALEQIQRLQGT